MVLVEALLLALAGGAIGLAVALGGLALVRALGLDRANVGFEFALDGTVLAYTLGAAVLAAVIVRAAAGARAIARRLDGRNPRGRPPGRRRTPRAALAQRRSSSRSSPERHAARRRGTAHEELLRSARRRPGLQRRAASGRRVLRSRDRATPSAESWPRFQEQALAELRALPGVSDAGITSILPFAGNNYQGSTIIDGYVHAAGRLGAACAASLDRRALPRRRSAFRSWRAATSPHTSPSPSPSSTRTSRRSTGRAASPLGERLRANNDPDRWYTIIGVVPAIKQGSLAETTDQGNDLLALRAAP